jgi:integrase
MPRVKLSERFIVALKPTDKIQRVYDSELHGLQLVCHPSGQKSFALDYGPKMARRRIAIGHWGRDMNLRQARDEARKLLSQVREGHDPLGEREQARSASNFSEWVDRFMTLGKDAARWSPRTTVEINRHLRRACEAFGRKKLDQITARDVEVFRDKMREEHGLTEANKSLSSVKACLGTSWQRGLVPSNEASKVSRIAGELPRTRTLSDDEMRRLLGAVEVHPDVHFKTAMLWLALTGARRSEVLMARWTDLRLDPLDQAQWTIPRAKNARPSVRPLPRELAEELARLPRASLHVIGEWSDKTFSRAWEALRDTAGLGSDVHLHDLRRTAGLWAARLGGLQMAQRLLGHANISTTARTYTPLSVDDLRETQNQAVGKILQFRKKPAEGDSK